MTTTPDPRQDLTAAQLIAMALGTSPPTPAESASPRRTGTAPEEAAPDAAPPSPA